MGDLVHANVVRFLIVVLPAMAFIGCQKGVPELKDIGASFQGITFNGSNSTTVRADVNGNAMISGQCDTRINKIIISFDDGQNWVDASGADVDCEDSSFKVSASLSSVTSQLGAFSIPSNKKFKLKGKTKIGDSLPASVTVTYGAQSKPGNSVLIASVDKTTGPYKIKARVGQVALGAISTGATMKLKSGSEK